MHRAKLISPTFCVEAEHVRALVTDCLNNNDGWCKDVGDDGAQTETKEQMP